MFHLPCRIGMLELEALMLQDGFCLGSEDSNADPHTCSLNHFLALTHLTIIGWLKAKINYFEYL